MDGCGEAGEAQGILQGSFDENFSATSWESCATSSQLRSNFVTIAFPIEFPIALQIDDSIGNSIGNPIGNQKPENQKPNNGVRVFRHWEHFWEFGL